MYSFLIKIGTDLDIGCKYSIPALHLYSSSMLTEPIDRPNYHPHCQFMCSNRHKLRYWSTIEHYLSGYPFAEWGLHSLLVDSLARASMLKQGQSHRESPWRAFIGSICSTLSIEVEPPLPYPMNYHQTDVNWDYSNLRVQIREIPFYVAYCQTCVEKHADAISSS